MSLLNVSNLTFDSGSCVSATGCTLDGYQEDIESCLPQVVKNYKVLAIINIVMIIIVGGFGNLLTIVAICVARIRHKIKFEHLWNSTTILMLNLSLCDLLYCVLGLPVFISIYYNEYLPESDLFCRYSAMLRNWIAYTDFLTMASIAVIRLVGLIFRYKVDSAVKRFFTPIVTTFMCVGIWILTFIIISPITFSMKIGPYKFGTFGYDKKFGKCDAVHCQYKDGFIPGGMIISVGFFVPFVIIIVSYVFISIILELDKRRTEKILKNQSQNPVGQIQMTLLALSISYVLFGLPMVIIENIVIKKHRDLVSLCVYCWYWWMYAINFLLYILTLEDFRKLYRQLLSDMRILKPMEDIDCNRTNPRRMESKSSLISQLTQSLSQISVSLDGLNHER